MNNRSMHEFKLFSNVNLVAELSITGHSLEPQAEKYKIYYYARLFAYRLYS